MECKVCIVCIPNIPFVYLEVAVHSLPARGTVADEADVGVAGRSAGALVPAQSSLQHSQQSDSHISGRPNIVKSKSVPGALKTKCCSFRTH